MMELEKDGKKLVGVEASVSGFKAVSIDGNGSVLGRHSAPFDRGSENLPQLAGFINSLKDRFDRFEIVGVAVPGLINRETNRVTYSAHIPEHSRVDLVSEIRSAAGVNVFIENDANSAAYGEYKFGAARGSKNLFYATIGAGVGGAFIFDGKIWRGVSGFAGEFGYVAINSDGMRLEDAASAANIVRRTRERFHQDSTSSLNDLEEQDINLTDIIAAAENGDDFAQLMLERTGVYVGSAIAGVINLLNIEKIVIGGEIVEARELVLDAIIARAREFSFGPSFQNTEIVAAELGGDGAAIGVALLAAAI